MNTSKTKILAVDDQADNLRVLVAILKEEYSVIATKKGSDALELAAREEPPALILLDIMMPEMDGYEVCQQLKANPVTADIPVIFVSATSDEAEFQKGLEVGASDFVQKPISPTLLKLRISRCLAGKS